MLSLDGQERELCAFEQECITQVTHLQELEFFCKQRTLQIVVDDATHSRKDGLEDNRGSTPFAS